MALDIIGPGFGRTGTSSLKVALEHLGFGPMAGPTFSSEENTMSDSLLTGRAYDVDLGPFALRLDFLADNRMRLRAQIGPTSIDEVVEPKVAAIRPNLFVVAWTEASGNFIVQVQDHDSCLVHNHARLADGALFQVEGRITAARA